MSTTIIDKLVSAGQALSGRVYRAVAGRSDVTGAAAPIRTNRNNSLVVAWDVTDGSTDTFGRIRASVPFSLGDISQVSDNAALQLVTSLTTGGTSTYSQPVASSELAVTTTAGSAAIRQSRQYFPYEPGRAQVAMVTGSFGAASAGVRKRIGYFDANNGIFFEQDIDGTVYAVLRSSTSGSPVDTKVAQAAWNIDPLNGAGPSQQTFDVTKFNVMFIGFGWLGGAGVTVGVILNGRLYLAHNFDVAALSTPFMSRPSLPVRWEIENVSGGVAGSLLQTCCAVFSEGGFDPAGVLCSVATTTPRTVGTTPVPVISVRLKSAYARGLLIPVMASAMVTTIDDMIAQVVVRGTLTGGAWADTSSGRTEYNDTATTITGGIVVASFFVNDNGADMSVKLNNALAIAADFAGTTDIISLVLRTDTASADVLASLSWKELV